MNYMTIQTILVCQFKWMQGELRQSDGPNDKQLKQDIISHVEYLQSMLEVQETKKQKSDAKTNKIEAIEVYTKRWMKWNCLMVLDLLTLIVVQL